jgi:hypothetical protein
LERENFPRLEEFGFSFPVELTYKVVSVKIGSVGMVWVVVERLFWPSAVAGFDDV